MDEEFPAADVSREDVVIFTAEGVVCERLGVSIDEAVVALADMAVTCTLPLVDMARLIVAGEIDPGRYGEARPGHERPSAPGRADRSPRDADGT